MSPHTSQATLRRWSPPVVLEARGLVKDYRRARAVDGVDLVVHAGERVGLLGPNGAGKTTTLLMLLGVITPDAGRSTICGSPRAATAARRPSTSVSRPATSRSPSACACASTCSLRAPLRHRRSRARDRGGPRRASGSSISPTRWAPSCRRVSARSSGSCGRRCTGPGSSCSTSRPRRSTPTSRGACAPGCSSSASENGSALLMTSHDMGEVEQVCDRVVFLSHGSRSSPTAHRARSQRGTGAATSRACSSNSPTGTTVGRPAERSPMSASDRPSRPAVQLHGARDRGCASARWRAARVRAGAEPASPVRRHPVAARRRSALRRARRLRRRQRPSGAAPGGRVPARRASCCGTSSTSRRSP